MRLEQLQPGDAGEIIDFLRTVFQADGDAPDTFAASMVAPGVAVATWLQPDAVSRPSTHMDRATPDIGVVPDPTAVTVYLDQPDVEVGVGAGLDLENDSAVLLESGSLVLIEAGVTGANAQPGSIAIPAYVDQCEVSWPGVTISDTFHAPPTAFYGQAGLADVTLDIWHASFNAQAPSTGSGAVPAPAQYDVAVPTPSVSTSGTDGNANPGDFTVSAFFDQCVVGLGANPGSVARPYQVAVMPSVVVLDAQGRVAHAFAGLIPRAGTSHQLTPGGYARAADRKQRLAARPPWRGFM